MDLSIIITFCNQDEYINDCVTNLKKLLLGNFNYKWEILIGLDRASSFAKSLAKNLSSDNIHFFCLKSSEKLIPFSRASENRFFLIRKAKGKYVMMLDGDDFYISVPNDAVALLDSKVDLIGVAYNFKVLNEKKKTIKENTPPYNDNEIITFNKYLSTGKWFHINCTVIRREAFDTFKEKLYVNDAAVQPFLLTIGNIEYLRKCIMVYRVGIDSIFAGQKEIMKKIQNCIMYEELYRHILPKKYEKRALSRFYGFLKFTNPKDLWFPENLTLPKAYSEQIKQRELIFTKVYIFAAKTKNYKMKRLIFSLLKRYVRVKICLKK